MISETVFVFQDGDLSLLIRRHTQVVKLINNSFILENLFSLPQHQKQICPQNLAVWMKMTHC
jgi:hypothetical protein